MVEVNVDSSEFVVVVYVVSAVFCDEICVIKFWPVVFAAAMAASPTSPARIMLEAFSLALKITVACAIAVKVCVVESNEQCVAQTEMRSQVEPLSSSCNIEHDTDRIRTQTPLRVSL